MLLQGNTSQVRNVQQDMMKVEGNVELTEQKSRKNLKKEKNAIKNSINQKYAVRWDL